MHRAIIHIGIEKTGSTAIQNFLYKNEKILSTYGYYFPWRTCGLISNYRLVIFTCNKADPNLLSMGKTSYTDHPNADFTVNPDTWRTAFTDDHLKEIRKIHEKHTSSTVVYSSEHFHSRVAHESEVQRLKDFLYQVYDHVSIIVYLRRQDKLAMSQENTSIQGGAVKRFSYSDVPTESNYFNFLSLVKRWSSIFREKHITVRIFEKNRLIGNDVGQDFKAHMFSDDINAQLENEPLHYERSNPRLSHSALETLLEFNRMPEDDSILKGMSKAELRQPLISALHELKDDGAQLLPSRKLSEEFYEHFRKENQTVFDTWGDGQSFDDDFSMYPDNPIDLEPVAVRELLEQYLPVPT